MRAVGLRGAGLSRPPELTEGRRPEPFRPRNLSHYLKRI